MVIEYERTIDDLVNFNLFHIKHSPAMRRQIFLARILVTILTPIFSLALIYVLDRNVRLPTSAYIISLIGGGILFFIYPYINRSTIIRRTKNILSEGTNKAIIGRQQIITSEEGLICETNAGGSRINWSSIERVAQDDKYIFLYIGAANAIVVPKSAFSDIQSQREFLDIVKIKCDQTDKGGIAVLS